MKILIVNGSSRKNGNTHTGLKLIEEGIKNNIPAADCNFINIQDEKNLPFADYNAFMESDGKFVLPENIANILDSIRNADVIVLGSPIYYFSISAQLKSFIDLFCLLPEDIGTKKVGFLSVGGDTIDKEQYDLAEKQIRLVCGYMCFDIAFTKKFSATERDDLANNKEAVAILKHVWEQLV